MFSFFRKLRFKIAGCAFRKHACVGENITWISRVSCHNAGTKNNVQIGSHGFLGCQLYALCGGRIMIGSNVYIGSNTSVFAKESVVIGSNVIISNNVLITDNNNHPTDPTARLKMTACDNYMTDPLWSWALSESKPVIIKDNVWIGRDATILKGVTVGEGSIIALGAIVTNDVPPYCVAAGNPARIVKQLQKPENI